MTRKSRPEDASALGWLASLKRKKEPPAPVPDPETARAEVLVTPPRQPRHTDMPYWLRDADTASMDPSDIPAWLLEDIEETPAPPIADEPETAAQPQLEPEPEPATPPQMEPEPEPAPAAALTPRPVPPPAAITVPQEETPVTQAIEAKNAAADLDEDLVVLERHIRAGERLAEVLATLVRIAPRYTGADEAMCYRLMGDAHYRRGEHREAMTAYRQGLALL